MMLCLAQSLIESQKKKKFDGGDGGDGEGGFDARDQVRKYLRWLDTGYLSSVGYCFDVGNATSVALGIWRGVLDKEERGEGKEEGREKEGGGGGGGGGGDDLQDGQVLIDRALKHEVVFSFLFFLPVQPRPTPHPSVLSPPHSPKIDYPY